MKENSQKSGSIAAVHPGSYHCPINYHSSTLSCNERKFTEKVETAQLLLVTHEQLSSCLLKH